MLNIKDLIPPPKKKYAPFNKKVVPLHSEYNHVLLMKKIVFAVMAFALFAGLTSCDKKGSMKELTVETSLICGDSVAQFKCTFSPTVSNGYFVFYSEERISADQHNEAFEQLYGIYEHTAFKH